MKHFIGIAALTLLLTACPYHGRVPLGEPTAAVFDPTLIGEWVPEGGGAFESGRLWVTRYDSDEYVVIGLGECPGAGGKAYITRESGHAFLNARSPSAGELYHVARLDREGDDIVVRHISSTFDSVSTSESFREIVRSRIDDPALYDGAVRMKHTQRSIPETGAAALALVPRACQYDGHFALSEPEASPEIEQLVGSWAMIEDKDTTVIEIERFNERELLVTLGEPDTEFYARTRAYVSHVEGAAFLNLLELGESDGEVMIARIDVAKDKLTARLLNSSVQGSAREPLRRDVAARLDDPGLYFWETMTLTRVK